MAIQSRKDARKSAKGKAAQVPVKSILKKQPVAQVVEEEEDEEDDEDFEDVDEDDEEESGEDEEELEDESEDDEDDEEDEEETEEAAPPKLFVARQNPDDLAVDDIGSDVSLDEDAVPTRKITINNGPALRTLTERIRVTTLPWPEHLVLSSKEVLEVDPTDDLQRETAFYKLALEQVVPARKLAAKHDIPFTRPNDYYAEMVKSDEHMERVRTKLVDEAQGIKKSEEAKRQRDLKKYGKQIQVEKLKQREMDRKGFQDRMQGIKRKRKDGMDLGDDGDEFGIEVDDAIADQPSRGGPSGRGRGGKSKMPRHARDNKFSVGSGGGRRSKQNTRDSANEFSGFGGFGGKGDRGGAKRGGRGGGARRGGNRPGKSRRAKGRN